MSPTRGPGRLEVHPLTPARWHDLETLFNGRGGSQVRGCWCMFYRRSGRADVPGGISVSEYNRRALKTIVDDGIIPGLIGYRDGKPVAWVSLGPREDYAKLAKSPVMRPVDATPVWSVICFYTAPHARREGVSERMLQAAADHARANGARLLEAYPVDRPARDRDDSMWFGAKRMYDRAGFVEVARRKAARPIMRKRLHAKER
jgi:GNAT superfamily N-acetyltransferase